MNDLFQMNRRKSVKAAPGDDDGWSDGEDEKPQPPPSAAATPSASTVKPAFKPAVTRAARFA
jgi:hypothetical protein